MVSVVVDYGRWFNPCHNRIKFSATAEQCDNCSNIISRGGAKWKDSDCNSEQQQNKTDHRTEQEEHSVVGEIQEWRRVKPGSGWLDGVLDGCFGSAAVAWLVCLNWVRRKAINYFLRTCAFFANFSLPCKFISLSCLSLFFITINYDNVAQGKWETASQPHQERTKSARANGMEAGEGAAKVEEEGLLLGLCCLFKMNFVLGYPQ